MASERVFNEATKNRNEEMMETAGFLLTLFQFLAPMVMYIYWGVSFLPFFPFPTAKVWVFRKILVKEREKILRGALIDLKVTLMRHLLDLIIHAPLLRDENAI